jgi:hypothetical protein
MTSDKINLHYILNYLTLNKFYQEMVVADNHSTNNQENTSSSSGAMNMYKDEGKIYNMLKNDIVGYNPLDIFTRQSVGMFPKDLALLLPDKFFRIGIKSKIAKGLGEENISFATSLAFVIYPNIKLMTYDDQMKHIEDLITYIKTKIESNYYLDKRRNTKKNQQANEALAKDFNTGNITNEVLKYVSNLFEINLLIFDLDLVKTTLYYTFTHAYPQFNVLRPFVMIALTHGIYEPIINESNDIPSMNSLHHKELVERILNNLELIECPQKQILKPYILVNPISFEYIKSLNIEDSVFIQLLSESYEFIWTRIDGDQNENHNLFYERSIEEISKAFDKITEMQKNFVCLKDTPDTKIFNEIV